jgi:branched-chain amino acid transport system ATP-binding protein
LNALSLRDVTRRFGGLYALRDITLDVAQCERLSLIGPNGAGKTTLFNVIAGDLRESKGQILLFDIDITKKPVRKRVGIGLRRTYQKSALFHSLTVAQNLYLSVKGLKGGCYNMIRKVGKEADTFKRISKAAETIGLGEKLDIPTRNLSHGEQRQLEFGMAIAYEPRLVMFDEPASGLSPEERKMLVNLLKTLPAEVTLLLIEHDMEVAFSVAERVVVLHEGRIVSEGSPEKVSVDPLVQEIYLGGRVDESNPRN